MLVELRLSSHSATAIVSTVSSVMVDPLVKSLKLFLDTGFDSREEPAISPITAPIIPLFIFVLCYCCYLFISTVISLTLTPSSAKSVLLTMRLPASSGLARTNS